MNPNDPKASDRFSQISESYSVLADPEKRRRYDRDYFRAQQTTSSSRAPVGHSGSYAGSRPPSGLSKRRGAFRGPPPSFYSHGGAAKNNSSSTVGPNAGSASEAEGDAFNARVYASNFDPAFDPSPVLKTQTQEDTRRHSRRAAAMAAMRAEMEDDDNFWTRFAVVTGVILSAVSVGTIASGMGQPKGGMTRGDGSRRGGPKNTWAKS